MGTPGRGLPALGFLTHQADDDDFVLGGVALAERAPAAYGGPLADRPHDLPKPPVLPCPVRGDDPYVYADGDPVVDWLGKSPPLLGGEGGEGAAFYARLWASLPDSAPVLLRGVPAGDVSLTGNLETLLRCFLEQADEAVRGRLQRHLMQAVLDAAPQSAVAMAKLRSAPPDARQSLPIVSNAMTSARCSTRAGGLALARDAAAGDPATQQAMLAVARAGMTDPCWQAKVAALRLWHVLAGDDAPPPEDLDGTLPTLVRQAAARPLR